MISTKINNLVAAVRRLVETDNLSKPNLLLALQGIEDCADQVADIERRPVPTHLRGERPSPPLVRATADENVVIIEFPLRAGNAEFLCQRLPQTTPTDGGAA